MVPATGIEPVTFSLEGCCSSTELRGRKRYQEAGWYFCFYFGGEDSEIHEKVKQIFSSLFWFYVSDFFVRLFFCDSFGVSK